MEPLFNPMPATSAGRWVVPAGRPHPRLALSLCLVALPVDCVPVVVILGTAGPQRDSVLDLMRKPCTALAQALLAPAHAAVTPQYPVPDLLQCAAADTLGTSRPGDLRQTDGRGLQSGLDSLELWHQ